MKRGGYVAIIAVVITAIVGLAIVNAMSALAFSSHATALARERSEQAKGLANACAELALQKMIGSAAFVGTANVPLGAGTCTYTVTQLSSLSSVIQATGTVATVVRKVKVAITVSNIMPVLKISSWQEISDF